MTVEMTQEQHDAVRDAIRQADINLTPPPGGHMGMFWGPLGKAQGAFEPLEKNRDVLIKMKTGGSYQFRYADLAEIRAKTTPALSANAFALVQLVTETDNVTAIRTILGHECGAQIESVMKIRRAEGGDIKDFGSAITYLRRYVVGALLGVAADDDIDSDGQDRSGDGGPELTRQAPISAEIHPGLHDAKTKVELAQVMNKIPAAERSRYTAYFAQRREELAASMPPEPTEAPRPQDDL